MTAEQEELKTEAALAGSAYPVLCAQLDDLSGAALPMVEVGNLEYDVQLVPFGGDVGDEGQPLGAHGLVRFPHHAVRADLFAVYVEHVSRLELGHLERQGRTVEVVQQDAQPVGGVAIARKLRAVNHVAVPGGRQLDEARSGRRVRPGKVVRQQQLFPVKLPLA
jgi:hypothetical protein